MNGTSEFLSSSTGRPYAGQYNIRRDIPTGQNTNFCPLVYTFEIELNLFDFNPRYPKEPKTLGEKIRKARMDRGMTLKEVAALFGISDTTVINWEIRGDIPEVSRMRKVKEFIGI